MILQSYCKECKRETDKVAYSQNTNNRRNKIRINAINQNKRARDFIINYKKSSKCKKCNDSRWYVLDFHHLRDKDRTVSELARRGASICTLKKEIGKCEVLCSNCHRELHYLMEKKLTK